MSIASLGEVPVALGPVAPVALVWVSMFCQCSRFGQATTTCPCQGLGLAFSAPVRHWCGPPARWLEGTPVKGCSWPSARWFLQILVEDACFSSWVAPIAGWGWVPAKPTWLAMMLAMAWVGTWADAAGMSVSAWGTKALPKHYCIPNRFACGCLFESLLNYGWLPQHPSVRMWQLSDLASPLGWSWATNCVHSSEPFLSQGIVGHKHAKHFIII